MPAYALASYVEMVFMQKNYLRRIYRIFSIQASFLILVDILECFLHTAKHFLHTNF